MLPVFANCCVLYRCTFMEHLGGAEPLHNHVPLRIYSSHEQRISLCISAIQLRGGEYSLLRPSLQHHRRGEPPSASR